MKRPSGITNVESRVMVPASLLENHVNNLHHPEDRFRNGDTDSHPVAGEFQYIGWCSEQIAVDGSVEIYFASGRTNQLCCMSIPVTTGFLVVCTRENESGYKLTWSCSLS